MQAEQESLYSENRNSLAATQAGTNKPPTYPVSTHRPEYQGYQYNAETSILDNSPRINPIVADRRAQIGSKGSGLPTQTSIDDLHNHKRKPAVEQPMVSFEMKYIP